jgi:hypothetical protein
MVREMTFQSSLMLMGMTGWMLVFQTVPSPGPTPKS